MNDRDTLRNNIPPHLIEGIDRWVERYVPPGDFLTAVLQNDLTGAVNRADDTSRKHLVDIVIYLYNYVPSGCWGSKEKFEAWAEGLYN